MSARSELRDQLRAAFMENLGLKVLSLACAVVLYALLHGSEMAQRTFSISLISIMPPGANRQLLSPLPTEVGITLKGPRKQLDELHADDIGSAHLDLSSGRDAKIDLDPSMFHIPTGLTVEQIIPLSINVHWDDVVSKAIPVQVPCTGEPSSGNTIKDAVMTEPAEVQARGPRSIIDVLQFARAAPFDVSGLALGTHRRKLALDKPPSLVTYDVDQIAASVQIARQVISRPFVRLRVEVLGPLRGTTRPSTVTVIATGTAEDLSALSPDAVVPRVEPKTAGDDVTKPGNDNLPVLVDLPWGITAQVDPPKVIVSW